MKNFTLSFIAAVDTNGLLGYSDGRQPWARQMPADMAFFKEKINSHTLIMGRSTYDATAKYLAGQRMIVLSRQPRQSLHLRADTQLIHKPQDVTKINPLPNESEVFVLGGGETFASLMPWTDVIYLTVIEHSFKRLKGSSYFPQLDASWQQLSSKHFERDKNNHYDYRFEEYRLKKSKQA